MCIHVCIETVGRERKEEGGEGEKKGEISYVTCHDTLGADTFQLSAEHL